MTYQLEVSLSSSPGVDRGQDFRPRPRPRKIQLVKTEAEDNRGFFFFDRGRCRGRGVQILTEAEEFWQKNCWEKGHCLLGKAHCT